MDFGEPPDGASVGGGAKLAFATVDANMDEPLDPTNTAWPLYTFRLAKELGSTLS